MRIAPYLLTLSTLVATAQAPAAEIQFEPFDTDPGWEAHNNRATALAPREIIQDFGYHPAVALDGAPGAIGGRITPDARTAYYGIALEPRSFDTPFSASGLLEMKPGGGNLLLGFFNSTTLNEWRTPNTLAFRINGRGAFFHVHAEYMTSKWRAGATVIGRHDFEADRVYPVEVPSEGAHAWAIAYDPRGNDGAGAFTVTFDGDTAVCNLDPGHRSDGATFDRFGLLNVIKHVDDPGEIFIDRLDINGTLVDLTTDAGWDGRDNRLTYMSTDVRPRFDFGYSPTHFAGGGQSGEIGGLFFRGDCRYPDRLAAYGARTGTLTLRSPLQAAGKITLRRGVTDSTTLFGFYHQDHSLRVNPGQNQGLPEHFMGFAIEGPSSEGFFLYPTYRGVEDSQAPRRDAGLPIIFPDGTVHDWTLHYTPHPPDGRTGTLHVMLGSQSAELPVHEGDIGVATFNRFGFVTPWIDGNGQVVYLDDLQYTVRQ